ncbi:MAG TPA: hypothetical protein VJ063_06195 [Verrucomicrobiae bacterium]|nr:hypothetical protein [Verrucomicrobiae bacterium]
MLRGSAPDGSAQIVSNGGFEIPLIAPASAIYTASQSFGGWTVDIGEIWVNHDLFSPISGFQSAYMPAESAFHQDLNTTVGHQYIVSYARACGCDAYRHTVAVSWGAESVTNQYFDFGATSSHAFTATESTTRLTFSTTSGDIMLDDVTVAPFAPPGLRPLPQGKWLPTRGRVYDVKVAGNYAYAGLREAGLAIIDVSDPAKCVRVGGYDIKGNTVGVTISGHHAFLINSNSGLHVIDVTNPTNCTRSGGYSENDIGFSSFTVSGNYAYLLAGNQWDGTNYFGFLRVVDISEPNNCKPLGGYFIPSDAWGVELHGIAVAGNYAYLASGHLGLQVIDVSNPTNCIRAGAYNEEGAAFNGVAVSGNLAYVAYGDILAGGPGDGGLQVLDVSDPANCVLLGRFYGLGRSLGVTASGNYAYVADSRAGLHVIDVSNPTICVRVGGHDASTLALAVTVAAGRIYVAAAEDGLIVLPSLPNVQFTVQVDATPGLPFTLETAANLASAVPWTPVLTTNVPVMPFAYVDFDVKLSEKPQKYYRVRQP